MCVYRYLQDEWSQEQREGGHELADGDEAAARRSVVEELRVVESLQ